MFTAPGHIGAMRTPWLLAAVVLAGCAAPLGRDGLPMSPGQTVCEALPFTRCCRPAPPPGPPPPYCTRSLGVADCWRDPSRLTDQPPELADTPGMGTGCG
jgi:hypothetical protein